MWIFFLLTSIRLMAAPAHKPILIYQSGVASYSIERSKTELILRSSPATYRIRLSTCNKKMIEPFLAEIKRKHSGLPIFDQSASYVQMAGIKRQLASIVPFQDSAEYFRRVPNIFLDISLKDIQKCGK